MRKKSFLHNTVIIICKIKKVKLLKLAKISQKLTICSALWADKQ